MKERRHNGFNGWLVVALIVVGMFPLVSWLFPKVSSISPEGNPLPFILAIPAAIFILKGFFVIQPNMARSIMFFGNYVGTARKHGLRWILPFFSKKSVSLRVQNFETEQIKVNDLNGNPVIAGAIVVWKVDDTAHALFEVQNYHDYLRTQSEAALRTLIMKYPYEDLEADEISLTGHIEEVSEQLKLDTKDRLEKAGVEILEARISHLSYAPEIAAAMLQRQQATAIVAARQKIVEGAVGMVEDAITQLAEKNVVELDDVQKSRLVSNLLVVLCGDRSAQPVVETSG